ncbi:MAG: hypothetical protein K8R36_10835 [Planctomycetales bacterium]|nr:hypothetical protein [Planctomycetales bacterium]
MTTDAGCYSPTDRLAGLKARPQPGIGEEPRILQVIVAASPQRRNGSEDGDGMGGFFNGIVDGLGSEVVGDCVDILDLNVGATFVRHPADSQFPGGQALRFSKGPLCIVARDAAAVKGFSALGNKFGTGLSSEIPDCVRGKIARLGWSN